MLNICSNIFEALQFFNLIFEPRLDGRKSCMWKITRVKLCMWSSHHNGRTAGSSSARTSQRVDLVPRVLERMIHDFKLKLTLAFLSGGRRRRKKTVRAATTHPFLHFGFQNCMQCLFWRPKTTERLVIQVFRKVLHKQAELQFGNARNISFLMTIGRLSKYLLLPKLSPVIVIADAISNLRHRYHKFYSLFAYREVRKRMRQKITTTFSPRVRMCLIRREIVF